MENNEEKWWMDREYWEHFVGGKAPTGEVMRASRPNLPKIVEEATRNGKMEALEQLETFIKEVKAEDPGGLREDASKEDFWDNGHDVGSRSACIAIESKLTELKSL